VDELIHGSADKLFWPPAYHAGKGRICVFKAPSFTAYHNSLPYSRHDLVGKVPVYFRICSLIPVIAGH